MYAKHDPSTGLHDVKPIPAFAIETPSPWPVLLGICLVLLLLFAAYRLRNRPSTSTGQRRDPESYYRAAVERLDAMDAERSSENAEVRILGETLSNILRRFLEETLGFPALESTPTEIEAKLPTALSAALPILPKESVEELNAQCCKVLRFCERATFSDDAQKRFSVTSEEFESAILESRQLLRKIHLEQKREEERTRSVIDDGHPSSSSGGGAHV